MERDLSALTQRIARLEHLLTVSRKDSPPPSSALSELRAARSQLRQIVPEEVTAAHRAIRLLATITTQYGDEEIGHLTSTTTAAGLEDLACELGLSYPPSANEAVRAAATIPNIPTLPSDASTRVVSALRDARRVQHAVDARESEVDALLMTFDAATARLNAALVSLAARTRALVAETDAA